MFGRRCKARPEIPDGSGRVFRARRHPTYAVGNMEHGEIYASVHLRYLTTCKAAKPGDQSWARATGHVILELESTSASTSSSGSEIVVLGPLALSEALFSSPDFGCSAAGKGGTGSKSSSTSMG